MKEAQKAPAGAVDVPSFDDLIDLGALKHVVELAGHKIILHTLNQKEYGQMTARMRDDYPNESKRMEVLQKEILAESIEEIDGARLSIEQKRALLDAAQLGLSNLLFIEYSNLLDKQAEILRGSQKNSSRGTAELK